MQRVAETVRTAAGAGDLVAREQQTGFPGPVEGDLLAAEEDVLGIDHPPAPAVQLGRRRHVAVVQCDHPRCESQGVGAVGPLLPLLGHRIGDSSTNLISPMMSFFALIVAFVQRYDSKAGIGTVIATMLPYSVAFLVVWMILLVGWIFFGLPLGPGAGLYLS